MERLSEDLVGALAGITSAREILDRLFRMACSHFSVGSLSQIQHGQIRDVVLYLDKYGAFEFRYAAASLAKELCVSKVTIYKYLKSSPSE